MRDDIGEHILKSFQFLDAHAQAIDDCCGDADGSSPQIPTTFGQADLQRPFVGRIAVPFDEPSGL
jgi:hypothetical protein